jgi:hypothetical protein
LTLTRDSKAAEHHLVARYHLDEGTGSSIADSSGNKRDAFIVGNVRWTQGIHGKAIVLDGLDRLQVPAAEAFNVGDQVSVSAWIRGHASKFRIDKLPSSYASLRGPYFQVCGDTIYFAANSDHASTENPTLSRDPVLKNHPGFPWNDWHLWTGTIDINLTHYHDTRRTFWPHTAVEPKLQVAGKRIYYEYFGQDESRTWQIYTAQSNLDGSGWKSTQRTFEPDGYRTEQEGNLQVAGKHVYNGWPEKDEKGDWQLWTSISDLDGSNFKAAKRTVDGGWIPNLQVVGGQVFYMYPTLRELAKNNFAGASNEQLYFAVSDRDGNHWRVIHTISHIAYLPSGWGSFQVHDGKIYFEYSQNIGERGGYLFTGSMDLDGGNFHSVQRTSGDDLAGPIHNSIQVLGNKVYYTYNLRHTSKTIPELAKEAMATDRGRDGLQIWTAESNLDGSDWKATRRTDGSTDIFAGYRGIDLVGGKLYLAAMELPHFPEDPVRMYPMMATAGANIVSKGSAFGIGLTENNEARAFVNGGLDYLATAQAPTSTAGATADFAVDGAWHFLTMTYDGSILKLYVDGRLKTSTPYKEKIMTNPFPLIIGDGFQGAIDEVSIYDRALSASQVRETYENFHRGAVALKDPISQ